MCFESCLCHWDRCLWMLFYHPLFKVILLRRNISHFIFNAIGANLSIVQLSIIFQKPESEGCRKIIFSQFKKEKIFHRIWSGGWGTGWGSPGCWGRGRGGRGRGWGGGGRGGVNVSFPTFPWSPSLWFSRWPNRQTRRTANPPQKLLASPALQNNRCWQLLYSPETNFTSKSWDFSVEIYKCFKFMFMGYSSSRQQTNYFPLCAIWLYTVSLSHGLLSKIK